MTDEAFAVDAPGADSRLRSGTAARLAGVPAATLRVWERRYGVVEAPKTAKGQRLYSAGDVTRLRLIKRLTGRGHAISRIAKLRFEQLQALDADLSPLPLLSAPTRARLIVVGSAAARRLGGSETLQCVEVHDRLDEAEAAPANAADVLVVHLASLQPEAAERVVALGSARGVRGSVVIYAFGAQHVIASLRSAGVEVCREPVTAAELTRLLASAAAAAAPEVKGRGKAAPRRFSDGVLIEMGRSPSGIACECLRHVCEIVLQVAAFETYSAECVSRSRADAALHRRLHDLAATTRTRFEEVLVEMADREGLPLDDRASRASSES